MIEVVNEILPKDKAALPHGSGHPQNILEAIERGVDMFDCVMPTRNGRNAMLFTYNGTMNMCNKKWGTGLLAHRSRRLRHRPHTLQGLSHHLFKAQELLAMQIASIHNLALSAARHRCTPPHRTGRFRPVEGKRYRPPRTTCLRPAFMTTLSHDSVNNENENIKDKTIP